jgi:hypothetical protein
VVDLIIDHLKLTFVADRPPPLKPVLTVIDALIHASSRWLDGQERQKCNRREQTLKTKFLYSKYSYPHKYDLLAYEDACEPYYVPYVFSTSETTAK